MRPRRTFLVVSLALVLSTGIVAAHDVSTRFDAPIPLSFLFGGAGATVALTALVLSATVGDRTGLGDGTSAEASVEGGTTASGEPTIGEEPADRPTDGRRVDLLSPAAARTLRTAARVGFLAAFAGVLVAGLVGSPTPSENPAVAFSWAVWLKGVGLLAVLFGSPWRTLAPWRTVHDALSALEGEREGDGLRFAAYPVRLGDWPALVGFLLLVGVFENLTRVPSSPRLTTALFAGYALVMLIGGVAFGRTWFRRADPLAVLYRLFGRVAPLRIVRGGTGLDLRPPWRGPAVPVGSTAVAAFVVAAVYTVSFDGFTATPEYQNLLFRTRDALGLGGEASVLLYFVGFAAFLALFAGVAAATRALADSGEPLRATARAFAPTVIPIAVAYEVAHNYPYVADQSARLLALLGGPGLDPLAWLTLPAFWSSQVLLVIGGHVVAVVAAHYVALSRYGRVGRVHLPLTALMVGYTVLSLWIISRPVVG